MSRTNQPEKPRAAASAAAAATVASLFGAPHPPQTPGAPSSSASLLSTNPIPSSSPAFATPAHPIISRRPPPPPAFSVAGLPPPPPSLPPSILPIVLPPATLRPLAFRAFTKRHGLTLTSPALQRLAAFVGRHCGAEWRGAGLAERVLDEAARGWKRAGGGVIVVDDDGDGGAGLLRETLKTLEASMSGGRVAAPSGGSGANGAGNGRLSRQNSLVFTESQEDAMAATRMGLRPDTLGRDDSQTSLGMSALEVDAGDEDEDLRDPRDWLKVVDAFTQPRLVYNISKKHFERDKSRPSLLPPPGHKTQLFRNRYNLIHQRLLRNESFQVPSSETASAARIPSFNRSTSALATAQHAYKLTPIANLLGRNGTSHLLLGLLAIAPTGTLAINDMTGSIALDLTRAKAVPHDGAWFVPGMIVLVDGVYEEEYDGDGGGGTLGGGVGGIGGSIGGKFVGFTIGGPPCERRRTTLGIGGPGSGLNGNDEDQHTAGGGFGWTDFMGVGSERAVGSRMRRIEQRVLGPAMETHETDNNDDGAGRARMVIIGEVNLDQPRTLQALRKILGVYAADAAAEHSPMCFVLTGNFAQHAVMARGGGGGNGSIEYKEYFDALASTLADYPELLRAATFVFVPGDNDGWASAFSAGAAVPLPRGAVPDLFTSRVKRAFAAANAEEERDSGRKTTGEAVWTSNPARVSLFGPTHEIVLFRDNITARLRRAAIRFGLGDQDNLGIDGGGDVDMGATATATATAREASSSTGVSIAPREDCMDVDSQVQAAESHLPDAQMPPAEKANNDDDGIAAAAAALHAARKLVKTVLDQGHLSPFRLQARPVLWDRAGSLQLYPLPTALVLADAGAPAFCVTYEGCHVMNPGSIVAATGRRGVTRWVEYDARRRVGRVREAFF